MKYSPDKEEYPYIYPYGTFDQELFDISLIIGKTSEYHTVPRYGGWHIINRLGPVGSPIPNDRWQGILRVIIGGSKYCYLYLR